MRIILMSLGMLVCGYAGSGENHRYDQKFRIDAAHELPTLADSETSTPKPKPRQGPKPPYEPRPDDPAQDDCVANFSECNGSRSEPSPVADGHFEAIPYGFKSIIAKRLLRAVATALRSSKSDSICRALAGLGGKETADIICKHRLTIATTLESLARWTGNVSRQILKDQLTGALHAAGLSHSAASRASFYIALAIDWAVL